MDRIVQHNIPSSPGLFGGREEVAAAIIHGRTRVYCIVIGRHPDGSHVWVPHRLQPSRFYNGMTWEEVSLMSRAEEKAFPKSVAKQAHELWMAVNATAERYLAAESRAQPGTS